MYKESDITEYIKTVVSQAQRIDGVRQRLSAKRERCSLLPMPHEPVMGEGGESIKSHYGIEPVVLLFGAIFGSAVGLVFGILILSGVISFPEGSSLYNTVFCPTSLLDSVLCIVLSVLCFALFFFLVAIIPSVVFCVDKNLRRERIEERQYKYLLDKYYAELFKYNKCKERQKALYESFERVENDCNTLAELEKDLLEIMKKYSN